MGLSRVRSDCNKGENQVTSFPNGDNLNAQKSFFGASSNFDVLVWLRGAALDPCNPQASHSSVQKLHKQALKTWKILLMSNSECPRRKRKLELFLKGSNSMASSRPSVEKSSNRSTKKVSTISSVSCSLNSCDGTASFYRSIACSLGSSGIMIIEDNFQGKQVNANFNSADDAKNWSRSGLSYSPFVETNKLVNGSTLSSLENSTVHDAPLVDLDDSVHNSDSLSSGIYMTPQQAVELLVTTGECPPRPVIPVGPRFQAELPEWTGSTTKKITYGDGDLETLKWLGTKCWPRLDASMDKTNLKTVGKGRPKKCSCLSPGSVNCVKRHINEARRRLNSDLGPVFQSWKFNEMGDIVSSSWTPSEQERFESLVKANPLTSDVDFWKCAKKNFPSKSKKSLVKYYYNVFIPRRMSKETRSPGVREIDSDNDLPDESGGEQAEEEPGKVQKFLKPCKR